MSDIFDQLEEQQNTSAPKGEGDIFDQLTQQNTPVQKGDIFDRIVQHPFKTTWGILANPIETLAGKSVQDRMIEDAQKRQWTTDSQSPIARGFIATKAALETYGAGGLGTIADMATAPLTYLPIPGGKLLSKIPLGKTTLGKIATEKFGSFGDVPGKVADMVTGKNTPLENALQKAESTGTRLNALEDPIVQADEMKTMRVEKNLEGTADFTPEEQKALNDYLSTAPEADLKGVPEFTGNDSGAFPTDEYGKSIAGNPEKIQELKNHIDDLKEKVTSMREEYDKSPDMNKETEAEIYRLGEQHQFSNEALKTAKESPVIPPEGDIFDQVAAPKLNNESGAFNTNIIPGVSETTDFLKNSSRELAETFRPAAVSQSGARAGEILRENTGKMAQSYDRAEAALAKAKNVFEKLPAQENYKFIDNVESGILHNDPFKDQVTKTWRMISDQDVKDVQSLGTGKLKDFIDNYFPHIWKDPQKASDVFAAAFAKKPLEGSKSFLNKRTIPTIKEGLDLGLEPVSSNPIDLMLIKHREVQRYVMAHRTLEAYKKAGLVKFVAVGGRFPAGFAKIDDKIANVFSRTDKGELIIRGKYYAQKDAARIINNYLSPGLKDSYLFNAYKTVGNSLNQFQLGLSAFHLGFTSVDAIVSRVALGLNKFAAGEIISGSKNILSSPLAPITNVMKGDKLYNAWFGKASTPEMKIIADVMASAGGRAKMDRFYETAFTKQIRENFRQGRMATALLKIPFAIVEQASKPIMEYLVPRQKLGVFHDLVKFEMDRNPNMSHDELRRTAQEIWNSVDNRMGQLVYDNLFWNKTTKDLAMASTRSVGWNLGTVRELGGGAIDTGKFAFKAIAGQKPRFTYRMAYIAALPLVVGTMGAIYQYLATGKGPAELKDYFFPKTGGVDKNGDPNRVALPSYMKDIYHYKQNPVQTIINKLAPQNAMIAQMLENKDFYGTKIRNEDDPIVKQMLDEIGYLGKQVVPFGIRNATKESYGQGGETKALSFVGITPAPYDINMSPAEKKASDILREKVPQGARTQEQSQESQALAKIRNQYMVDKKSSTLTNAVRAGAITRQDAATITENSKISPLQRMVKNFSVEEVYRVMEDATPAEQKELKRIFIEKMQNKLSRSEDLTRAEVARIKEMYKNVRLGTVK